ncbi:MAG TPA: hypothetical protein VMC84_11305 [Methanocella sp.]|uniref:hypothetical protein n=1 Tax=Methanocella sp. TaxID=2052833 RepID=UPI002C6A8A8E|nr:hypothetical protein [Methanocella sp.]HTY91753.1 hypothetical protein [Methanocella sp.]
MGKGKMQGNTVVKAMAAIAVLIFISALALTVYRSGGAALNWQMGADDPLKKIYPSDDGLYVVGTSNISLVDAAGKTLWSIPFPNTAQSAYINGRLLVYSQSSGLNAVGADGTLKALTRQSMNYPPTAGPDDTILIRSYDLLSAIDLSGREQWNASGLVSDPVMDGNGNVYFFTRPPEHMVDVYLDCISPGGSLRWSIQYPGYDSTTKLKAARDDGVYVYDEPGGVLDCLSSYGNVRWDHTMPYLGQYSLVEDEHHWLYMFYMFGTVHVVNEQGTLIGKFNPAMTYGANLSYMPSVCNGTIYVAGDSGKNATALYALSIDGSLKWKHTFNGSASPAIYAGKDIVCIGADTKNGPVLYVVDSLQGDLIFTYNSGDGSGWEQVYIDENDTIYAKTCGGMLYALKG